MSKKQNNLYLTSLAGTLAGSISKICGHPIDTIKTKIQVNTSKITKIKDYNQGFILETIKKVYRNQGIKGFFPGLGISVIGSAFAFSAYMTAYQFAKQKLKSYRIFAQYQSLNYFVSGLIAEAVSCLLWLPIDVIKQRLQAQSQLNIYSYKNSLQACQRIMNTEGIQGLYRAYGATLMFFGPYSAIIFMSYQKIKKLICKNSQKATLSENIIATSISSSFAGFITNPLQLSKLRMQIQRADRAFQKAKGHELKMNESIFGYRNMFHGIYMIYKNEGFLALYRGGLLRIMFTTPTAVISFSLTDMFRQYLREFEQ